MQNGGEMRITDAELEILKNTFSDNVDLIKLLRKIFLPEITADDPIGQNIDLWMTIKIDDMSPEQAMVNIKARNSLITHIDTQLMVIKSLAGSKKETVEETKERLQKDSAR
tara:strand:- start:593 stop:925 length:333 start_codon:yes stop_codon:yes gene_type:complete